MSAVRTHFLRGQSGAWWRLVESMGIEHDMSLGWARDVGFRSGISRPFQAYDLQEVGQRRRAMARLACNIPSHGGGSEGVELM